MAKRFTSEAELAEKVVAWLEADQWDVYQEVQLHTRGSCADIVAQRGPLVMIVECKLSASLDLIEQLYNWEGYAHYLVAATPMTNNRMFGVVAKQFGFGRIPVCRQENVITHVDYGDLRRKPHGVDRTRGALTPERKTFAKAGNCHGAKWTPFQQTCMILAEIVQASPGISFKAALDLIRGKHHYRSDSSARSSLLKWGLKGSVKGVSIRKNGRAYELHPTT